MSTRAGPRPAPTIILLPDLSGGPEAFMLQRTRSAAFLPGAYVFPGGALDATDRDPRAARRVLGVSDERARAPESQSGAHDEAETVHSFWVAPREALARQDRGEIEIIFPTRTSLEDL